MRHVKIVDAGLYDDFAKLNLTTGEIIKENNERPIRITVKRKGFKYEMAIRKFQIGGITDHYLVIILNAKMLKEKYFNGLNHKNIREVFDEVNGLGFVTFTWEDFLKKSYCTDIDICMDYRLNLNSFNNHLITLMEATPYSRERYRGYKKYGHGIEWNNRTTATTRNPFLKVYNKERELWSRSNIFTETYLKESDIINMRRIEFTVKDAIHLLDLNVTNSSLDSVLSITQLQRVEMMKEVLNRVFDITQVAEDCDPSGKPEHTVWVQAMRYMYGNGFTKEGSTKYLIAGLNTNNKSKYRKKLGALWQTQVEIARNDSGKDLLEFYNLN